MSVVRTFAKFRAVAIQLEDGTGAASTPVFANIAEMAKYDTLSETGPRRRTFEVITLPHTESGDPWCRTSGDTRTGTAAPPSTTLTTIQPSPCSRR